MASSQRLHPLGKQLSARKIDTVTPQFMGQDIYDAISSSKKMIWTVDDSEHTDMWLDHNPEYIEHVDEVLRELDH